MFPLVHYQLLHSLIDQDRDLAALGGLFPDLAVNAGIERNYAHRMGNYFYHWCGKCYPQSLALARGIISHGVDPHGIDYYADEHHPHYPDYLKGWCFKMGESWMPQIAACTKLPDDYIWWKSHNFVEMAAELLTLEAEPGINHQLLHILRQKSLVAEAAQVLSDFIDCEPQRLEHTFHQAEEIFALEQTNSLTLAQKQAQSFRQRFQRNDADIPAMAALLDEMVQALRTPFQQFHQELRQWLQATLDHYPACYDPARYYVDPNAPEEED